MLGSVLWLVFMIYIFKEVGDVESWFVLGVGDGVCDFYLYDIGIFC